jgi:hypothetical protein
MRFLGLLMLWPGFVLAQGWVEYANVEEGFFANFPGEPKVEETTWESEYEATFPARVYSVDTDRGRYSMTVIDYRDAERIHTERVRDRDCPPGAETCSGGTAVTANTGIGYWRVDVQASMVYGAWQFLQRDAEVTHFMWNNIDFVEGLQLYLTNPDHSRTFASLYLHADRLYILEATTPEGVRGAGLFQQSLVFLDEEGNRIDYDRIHHNSAPPLPRLRDAESYEYLER